MDCTEIDASSLGSSIEPVYQMRRDINNSHQTATIDEEEEDSDDLCEINLSEVLNNKLSYKGGRSMRRWF